MSTDYKFEGWVGEDASSAKGNMVWKTYEPKTWEETDVDIKITHCGVCGTDIHMLRSGWRATPYPVVVGHEIVGTVVRVGSKAEGGLKIGDTVGVGAQSDSCQNRDSSYQCGECSDQAENYCARSTNTYGSKFLNGDKSYGGYGQYHRCPSHFVIKVPDGLAPEFAAPMLCGGVTTYSPLKRFGAGPGKKIGVIGVGGLGHFAVMFARALGAETVVGISRREAKRQEALQVGCTDYLATEDDEQWASKYTKKLDLVINTISSAKMPFTQYLSLLKPEGTLIQVGLPEEPIPLTVSALTSTRRRVVGSLIGSPSEIREMFQLAVDKKIKPWVEQRPMKDANQAIIDFEDGKARFRYVLSN